MKVARILVVDDNRTNLKLVSELLAHEGHEVISALDAEQAQIVLHTMLPADRNFKRPSGPRLPTTFACA